MKIFLTFVMLIFSFLLCAQSSLDSDGDSREYTFFKGEKTMIKNPFELRDPFKEEIQKRTTKKKLFTQATKDGSLYSNLNSVETLTSIDKLKIVGVLLGKERRALAKVGDGKEPIMLKEGTKIGPDNIELKAILPGGVVFIEKIKNVYDQDEYLETVIPVSTE